MGKESFVNFATKPVVLVVFQSGTFRNIKQFHFYGWTDSIPKSGEAGILDLIGQVQRTYLQQDEEGPITVHCR